MGGRAGEPPSIDGGSGTTGAARASAVGPGAVATKGDGDAGVEGSHAVPSAVGSDASASDGAERAGAHVAVGSACGGRGPGSAERGASEDEPQPQAASAAEATATRGGHRSNEIPADGRLTAEQTSGGRAGDSAAVVGSVR